MINVLIDGYNVQMPNGTGIKTYTLTLIKALQLLKLKPLLLTSLRDNGDAKIAEILYAESIYLGQDRLNSGSSLTDWLKSTYKLAKFGANTLWRSPQIMPFSGRVILNDSPFQDLLKSNQVLNLEGVYDISRLLYEITRQQTTIRCDIPIDIWHRTYPLLPVKVPLTHSQGEVITLHDLIPLKLPYLTADRKKEYYRNLKTILKDKPLVTTPSERSRQDILEFFDIEPERIRVAYLPTAATPLTCSQHEGENKMPKILDQEALKKVLRRYRIKPKEYFLFVGTIEPRKNLSLLLRAFFTLDTSFNLVIVGKFGWQSAKDIALLESMFGTAWKKRVKILDFVKDKELPYLYQGAFSLVFPSLYEGFGLPPLEAMSWGCPVISTNSSSLPEVCGESALYFDPYDVNSLQDKMEKMMNDQTLRNQLIDSGINQARQFNLERFSKDIWSVYSQLL